MQDPRVDVCVYFIAPHRLKQMDVEFMKRLSLVSLDPSLCRLPLILAVVSPIPLTPPPLPIPDYIFTAFYHHVHVDEVAAGTFCRCCHVSYSLFRGIAAKVRVTILHSVLTVVFSYGRFVQSGVLHSCCKHESS